MNKRSNHGRRIRVCRRPARPRGIVLLIVLGMLSLFTVLIVSFVVYSSQSAQSSVASQERRIDEILPAPPIEAAVLQMIAGTDDHKSAAYGASLLEDFYGVDGVMLRVGHKRTLAGPPIIPTANGPSGAVPGGQLLQPLIGNVPQTTLFKFPTSLTYWNEDGDAGQADLVQRNDARPYYATLRTNLTAHLDDVITGRVVTFDEGPLKNKSFRVIRYFGIENGTDDNGVSISNNPEYCLAGNIVIDLSELGTETVIINGVPEQLYTVAANYPNALLYSTGDDGEPGRAGFDDNGSGGTDDPTEIGAFNSDDVGYRFVLNGGVFNGYGVNPDGVTGLQRTAPVAYQDQHANIEFTLNTRITGAAFQAGAQTPQFDETWDAADWENIFLAWQPSDHRRPTPNTANQVYNGVDADQLNSQMGQHVIPSFHRPAIINYIMNSPIRLPGEPSDPSLPAYNPALHERTFADIKASPTPGPPVYDDARLNFLVLRLRRATIRHLNFPHEFIDITISDLDGDGVPFDGAPQFSGSNSVSILNQTIDMTAGIPSVINQIENLARWLVNGPWDIDNDGDGLPDSIWVDFNLPVTTGPDGKLLKPLIAPLIEDLDGKINVNYAGSYNQLTRREFFRPESILPALAGNNTRYGTGNEFDAINRALNVFGHGGGIGPAEIDFRHLFQTDRPYSTAGHVGPLATSQTDNQRSLDLVLRTRYGNLLNVRYGGSVFNYSGADPYDWTTINHQIPTLAPAPFPQSIYPFNLPYPAVIPPAARLTTYLRYPGVGNRLYPTEQADLLARIPFPSRTISHSSAAFAGRPVDLAGTETTRKDTSGSHFLGNPIDLFDAHPGADVANHPYEFGATEIRGDDTPFTPAEYVDFLAGGPLGGRLSQLLTDAAEQNEALPRLITTESRSVDSPEVPGLPSLVSLISQRFQLHNARGGGPVPANGIQSTLLNRMLAIELRKGSKLNLNRQIGNTRADTNSARPTNTITPPHPPNILVPGLADESGETAPHLRLRAAATWEANRANNRSAAEPAFPQLDLTFPQTQGAQGNLQNQSGARAHYGSTDLYAANTLVAADRWPDFNGVDLNNDGVITPGTDLNGNGALDYPAEGEGVDFDGDGEGDEIASGSELLARHLYCLMFALITADIDATGELVPNYPYPGQLGSATVPVKNAYVARQLAQWAVNAVDYRDIDAKFTRLRFDPNPFDENGFNLAIAADNVVWGMERPEAQLTESIALHDKRLKRDLPERLDTSTAPPTSFDGDANPNNNELPGDDEPTDTSQYPSDSDMDQFRMPQASAFIELQALAPPVIGNGSQQPSLPGELYTNNRLDLTRVVGFGDNQSPVWRIAVGSNHGGDRNKSTRWMFDADRINELEDANHGSGRYLGLGLDWNANRVAERDNWNGAAFADPTRYSADIRNSRTRASNPAQAGDADPQQTEFVTIGDDDFDPTNDPAGTAAPNPSRIQLERFVWFADLRPDATPNLRVVNDHRSGMRVNNVFFHRRHDGTPADPTLPENAAALLAPGQYAVVAPRAITYFGQNANSVAPNFPYDPSNQRIAFARQSSGNIFRLNYWDSTPAPAANPMTLPVPSRTPQYAEDNIATSPYHEVNEVIPIICQSLYPNEVPTYTANPLLFDWQDYFTGIAVDERVDMGFNISAPLPGPTYYPAPKYQITSLTNVAPQAYPYDGYSDVENAAAILPDTTAFNQGYFPDVPLDHLPGMPMEVNSYLMDVGAGGDVPVQWNAVGTHQEAATVFLQRLADPTRPWHATNNPYVTLDFLPMDLTTFNGEHDIQETVQRKTGVNGVGVPILGPPECVDNRSTWDPTLIGNAAYGNKENGFVPEVQLDTRRKIPDLRLDRALSALVPAAGAPERAVITHRPRLMMTTSDLRPTTPIVAAGNAPYWRFDLGAMWSYNHTPVPGIDTRYRNPSATPLALDGDTLAFRQSLGFVNREIGPPTQSNLPRNSLFAVGEPDYVLFHNVSWMNREYRSPMDLINVPAVSRTRLMATYTPGSELEDNGRREIPTDVWESIEYARSGGTAVNLKESHLLGFATGVGSIRRDDYLLTSGGAPRPRLSIPVDDTSGYDDWTGGRAGFEMIFDYVDAGPVWFDSQRWLDPLSVQFRRDVTFDTPNASVADSVRIRLNRMFNRTVETLQPPYNYVGLHRTPGKINLNTTPDYIRKGPSFQGTAEDFLDGRNDPTAGAINNPPQILEDPSRPAALPFSGTAAPAYVLENPSNDSIRGDGLSSQFATSQLFGNGSVFRSLAWGHSTLYELDVAKGSPATLGQNNRYFETVDTSFGRGFKAFIESRRGYSTTAQGISPSQLFLSNPILDYRYPTQFAGLFAPAIASRTPSVQRFMRQYTRAQASGSPRRMHDMGLLRPHPDFDLRTLSPGQLNPGAPGDTGALDPADTRFSLLVEADATANLLNDPTSGYSMPGLTNGTESELPTEDPGYMSDPALAQVRELRMPLLNTGLFERPQAELHMNQRGLDRDSFFRYRHAARLAGMTTNHSNVYMVRLTLSYFEVDPETGAVGAEFITDTGAPERSRATYIIDRTIPVGFLRGKIMNTQDTILYSEFHE